MGRVTSGARAHGITSKNSGATSARRRWGLAGAFVVIAVAGITTWARVVDRLARLGEALEPERAWASALDAGARLLCDGAIASVTEVSTIGPLAQAVAAISIAIGGSMRAGVIIGAALASGAVALIAALAILSGASGASRLGGSTPQTPGTASSASLRALRALRSASSIREGRAAARAGLFVAAAVAALAAGEAGIVGLALVAAVVRMERRSERDAWTAGAWMLVAIAWAPWAIFAVAPTLALSVLGGRARAGLRASAVVIAGLLAWVGLAALAGDAARPLASALATPLVPTWPAPELAFVALVALWATWAGGLGERSRSVLVLAAAGLVGCAGVGPEPYALLVPMAIASTRALVIGGERTTRWVRPAGALLVALFAFGAALAPAVPRSRGPWAPAPVARASLASRVEAWIAAREGCVLLHGPVPLGALDPARTRRADLERARAGACPFAIVRAPRLARPDVDLRGAARADGIDETFVALLARYAPIERVGADTVALARRSTTAPAQRAPLSFTASASALDLEAPLSRDSLVELTLGGADEPALVAVDARAVAWRWLFGARPASRPHPARLSIGGRARVRAVHALTPPAIDLDEDCAEDLSLDPAAVTVGPRGVTPSAEGFALGPRVGVPADLDVAIDACPGACLYAELGIEDGTPPVDVRITQAHPGGVDTLSTRRVAAGWRQPFELPLRAGPSVIGLRVETESRGARAVLRRPRVAPCVARFSVVHALHEGERRVVPEHAPVHVIGDEVRVPVWAGGVVPPRVEIPLVVPRGPPACVALELRLENRDRAAGALIGVRRDAQLYRLERRALEPGAAPIVLRDMSIERFAGERVALVLSAWPYDGEEGGHVAFVRPRVHTCGDPAAWGFSP